MDYKWTIKAEFNLGFGLNLIASPLLWWKSFSGNFQKEGVASFFPWVFINYHTQTWIISTFINCTASNLESLHLHKRRACKTNFVAFESLGL